MRKHPLIYIIFVCKISIPILTAILIFKQPDDWIRNLLGGFFSFMFISVLALEGQYVGVFPSVIAGRSDLLALLNLKKVLIFPMLAFNFYFTNLHDGLYIAALLYPTYSAFWILLSTKKKNKILKSSDTIFEGKYNMKAYRKFDALNYFIMWVSIVFLVYIWEQHGFVNYFWWTLAASFVLQIIISAISVRKAEKNKTTTL